MNEDQYQRGGAPPVVPSLLQMAQGVAPAMGGGGVDLSMLGDMGRGGGFQSNPEIAYGAPYRAITSPEDQNASDLQGNPIHAGGPAPAYMPGTTFGGYNAIFDPNAPSANGGWFTMQDYNAQAPEGAMTVPRTGASHRQNSLSTNNWRLLPEGFRTPDHFMYDGTIISRSQAGRDLSPKSVLGIEGGGFPGWYNQGAGMWSTPLGYASRHGYIGSGTTATTGTSTY